MRILRSIPPMILIAVFFLSGCENSDTNENDKTISLGVILPLDNDNGPLRENAIRTALADINANGGIADNYQIELIVASSEGSDRAVAAAAAADQIRESADHLAGFIIAYSSSSAGIINWMTEDNLYPLISGSATADNLSGISPYFRRLVPPDSLQAKAFNHLVEQYNIQSVAIAVQEGDNFSEGLAARFKEYYRQTISAEINITANDPDYDNKINQLLASNPKAIFISMLDAGIAGDFLTRLSQRSSDHNFANVYFMITDALHSESLFSNSLDLLTGTINGNPKNFGVMSAPDTSSAAYLHFADRLMELHGQAVGSFNAQFYDAVYIFALAMEQAAQSTEPDEDGYRVAVNTSISAVCNAESSGDAAINPTNGWAQMKQLVAGGAVDYSGASGNCDIDAAGNTMTPYQVFTISGTANDYRFEVIDYYTP